MLTGIRLNNWLAHRYADLPLTPLTVIAGPNGTGKSSVADAIAFALTGEVGRIEAKSERERLLSEGAGSGSVELRGAGGALVRDIATGKITQPAGILPEGLPEGLAHVLLAPSAFSRMTDDARRVLLFQIAGVSLSRTAMPAMLIERGHPERLVKLMPFQGDLARWQKDAEASAAEARGAWKAATGEVYGAKKAEGWKAPVPEPVEGQDEGELRAQVALLENAVAECNRAIGAARAAIGAPAIAPAEMDRLRRLADGIGGWTQQDAEAHAALLTAKRELREALDELANLPTTAAAPEALHCPDCGSALMLDPEGRGKHLVRYSAGGDPVAAQQARQRAEARVTEARGAVDDATQRSEATERGLRQAQEAKRQLDRAAIAPDPAAAPAETVEELEARLADHQRALTQAREDLAAIGRHGELVKRAAAKTEKAAAAHQDAKAWSAIANALAPDGIAAEVLGKALGPLNQSLTELAAQVGWRPVAIAGDMSVTAGGRPYGLMSESEQWRADALIALALARMAQVGLVVLDRFDVLDLPSRGRALKFLFDLTRAGEWSVIVCGTFKAPPQVPPAIRVHWFGPDSMEKAA